MTAPALVQKLWNYCNILRDDGLSYGDYVEQLTFLLFLKMADEQSRPPYNKPSPIPRGFGWDKLVALDGDDLNLSNASFILDGESHAVGGTIGFGPERHLDVTARFGTLAPADAATTVRGRGRTREVSEGPLADGEQLVGVYLIDAADLDTALRSCELLPSAYAVELRPVIEIDRTDASR